VSLQACGKHTPLLTCRAMLCVPAGLLEAYSAAVQAAASFLSASPQLPRSNSSPQPDQTISQLMDNSVHLIMGASNTLLLLWNTIADLMLDPELLSDGSILQDSAVPSASLAMVLARAYAGDHVFCAPVMYHVLATALMLARAAVAAPPDKHHSTMVCQEVFELLLLCFAVGTGLLHAQYNGSSQQSLLPSIRVTSGSGGGCSSSSKDSKPGRLAVSAHHEELLKALVGVWQLPASDEHTAAAVMDHMWLIPHAVCEAGRVRLRQAYSSPEGPDDGTFAELVPWPLALPLLLTQVELLALVPPFFARKLAVVQQLLSIVDINHSGVRTWADMQQWQPPPTQQQQQQRSGPNAPSLDTVQSHLQLFVQALWLQLGPALLALCRRSSGEAVGEDQEGSGCGFWGTDDRQPLCAHPRQAFAAFSDLLMNAMPWQGRWA
jgi:hypothetical protein